MTVVIAIPFFKQLVVLADSRISYGVPSPHKVDDILQKIYLVGNNAIGYRTVVGFSGPLAGAYQVFNRIEEYLSRYKKPANATNVIEDLVRCIKHEYRKINLSERRNLSFLLAGIEPTRDRSISRPDWIPFSPQTRLVTLIPNSANTKLLLDKGGFYSIIGDRSNAVRDQLELVLQKYYGLHFKNPVMGMQVIIDELVLFFMHKQSKIVGGMFQCAMLDANGTNWFSYGRRDTVSLEFIDGQYWQLDHTTGKRVRLISIKEWQEYKDKYPQGYFGVTEDPLYRSIINRQLNKQTKDGEDD